MANPYVLDNASPGSAPGVRMRGDDDIDLQDVAELVVAGRRIVGAVAAGVLTAAIAVCVMVRPSYEAGGVLRIDDTKAGNLTLGGTELTTSLLGSPDKVASEIELLKTRRVVDPVIDALGLAFRVEPVHFPVIGEFMARHRSGDGALADAPPGLGAWVWGGERVEIEALEVPDEFLNTALTLRVGDGGSYALRAGWGRELVAGRVGAEARSADGGIRIKVAKIVAREGTRFDVTRLSHDEALAEVLDRLAIEEQATSSGVVSVRFTAPSRRLAADVVNNVMDSYIYRNSEKESASAAKARAVLARQMPRLEKKLAESRSKLVEYQHRSGAPNVVAQTDALLQSRIQVDMKALDLRTELGKASQNFGPRSPTIRELQRALAEVTRQQTDIEANLDALPQTQQELQALVLDVERAYALYTMVDTALHSFDIAPAGSVGRVWIVDPALAVFEPVFPRPLLLISLALVLGPLLGVLAIFVLRALLRGPDAPAEVESASGHPIRTVVPFSLAQRRMERVAKRRHEAPGLLAAADPTDLAVESLGVLSTFVPARGVTMIGAPAPSAGRTFTAANVGAILAQSGRRVVVVDADLRAGKLHHYFGVEAGPGLAEYIAGSADAEELLQASGIEGYDFVSSGEHHTGPYEMLRHPRMGALVELLAARYDVVLLIAAPVLVAPDAEALGRLAGCTFLMIGAARHRAQEIRETCRRLDAADVRIGGVVLNRAGEKAGGHGERSYGLVRPAGS